MSLVKSGVPSAVRGSNWPDGAIPLGNEREKSATLKSDAEREADARAKLARMIASGAIGKYVPKLWGPAPRAVEDRGLGAERIHVAGRGVQAVFPGSNDRGPATVSQVIAPGAWEDPESHREVAPTGGLYWPAHAPGAERLATAEAAGAHRGLARAVRLYRTTPIVGTVFATHVREVAAVIAVTPTAAVGRRKRVSEERRTMLRECRARGAGTTRDEIAAARERRDAARPVLCDARNAPPRVIYAF